MPTSDITLKQASGVLIYLTEELGDARLRAAQLKTYVQEALDLVEKSTHRDHFFEVAANLIHGIPDTLFKLDKALDAAAMAAARMDYEEIKQGLKPEKAEELERVLDDVRLRYLNRRSNDPAVKETPMNAQTASAMLTQIAEEIDATGVVPVAKVAQLIDTLEQGTKTASTQPKRASAAIRAAADFIVRTANPSRAKLASNLRKILADSVNPTAGAGEEFQKENPKITDEEVKKINEEHEKNKDNFKAKKAAEPGSLTSPDDVAEMLPRMFEIMVHSAKDAHIAITSGNEAKAVQKAMGTIMNAAHAVRMIAPDAGSDLMDIANKAFRLISKIKTEARKVNVIEARFERGKPADPTENMSKEDADRWWEEHEKNKDNFKAATMTGPVAEEAKESRFEEGKPADPTKNMDKFDKDEWWEQNDKHKDNFKAASTKPWWE
jgi:uncharacterized protein YicC (UPF0701 family)